MCAGASCYSFLSIIIIIHRSVQFSHAVILPYSEYYDNILRDLIIIFIAANYRIGRVIRWK